METTDNSQQNQQEIWVRNDIFKVVLEDGSIFINTNYEQT